MRNDERLQQDLLFPAPTGGDAHRRLLILSCSERKSPAVRPIPAIERYDGPAFRVLRRFLDNATRRGESPPSLLVISAKHGLIAGQELVSNYNERLSSDSNERVKNCVREQLAQRRLDYDDVLVSTSRAYEPIIEGLEEHFPRGTRVARTRGPRGKQLAQLRNWLECKPLGVHLPEHHFPRRGIARLKGIERSLAADQLLQCARAWLEEARQSGERSPWRFLDRYVMVDGERVAPKWLVGRLFDLPVTSFETPDSRRVLEQLGIPVYTLRDSNDGFICADAAAAPDVSQKAGLIGRE